MTVAAVVLAGLAGLLCLIGWRAADIGARFDVGSEKARRTLLNFYTLERSEGVQYRWSQADSVLFFYGFDGSPAILDLRLASGRSPDQPPTIIAPRVGTREIGAFDVVPSWRRYHILTPTNATGNTAVLLNSQTFQPENDRRVLGVALSQVAIRPLDMRAYPFQRAIFLVSLPLLALLLLVRVRASMSLALGVGLALALCAGLAARFPAVSGYLLPTFWWPWWPLLPLLGLAFAPTMGLAIRRGAEILQQRATAAFWGGLALALAALVTLRLGVVTPSLGIGALLISAVMALGGMRGCIDAPDVRDDGALLVSHPVARRVEGLALPALTLLALVLRLYDLNHLPLGLWRDEARHGLLALQIWRDPGFRPVYVAAGADLPALLFYLMAPVVGVFGPDLWSVRLAPAVIGAFTPLAIWWAAKPIAGPRAALFAAALLTWASWSLSMSRWAFPATLDQALLLVAVGLLWRGLGARGQGSGVGDRGSADRERGRPGAGEIGRQGFEVDGRWSVVGGRGSMVGGQSSATYRALAYGAGAAFCAGLAVYGYHTGRMAPIILAALTIVCLGRSRVAWRQAAPVVGVAAFVGLLTVAPMLVYIANNDEAYNRRVAQVSFVNSGDTEVRSPLLLALRNVERYAQMWHVRGDRNGRHHAPYAPMVDPLVGLLMLLGLGVAFARRHKPAALAVLVWLLLSLTPGFFSTDAPHAMRSLGALGPTCLLAGVGMVALLQRVQSHALQHRAEQLQTGAKKPVPAPPSVLHTLHPLIDKNRLVAFGGALLVAGMAFNLALYFRQMPYDPRVYTEFDVGTTAMARLARLPFESDDPALRAVTVFLSEMTIEEETARLLLDGLPINIVDDGRFSTPPGEQALVLLPTDAPPEWYESARAALGPEAFVVENVPRYPGSDRPLFLALGKGEAAATLMRVFENDR
jgi:4-amino-4-deoxy-L-arabinose transferase-like glycosyltransferase